MVKNLHCSLKKVCFFICLIFVTNLDAQIYSIAEIDSLQKKEYERLMNIGDYKGVTLLEQKLINYSKKLNYSKGEIRGYINLAGSLLALNRNKESLHILEKADEKLKALNDNELKARLYDVYGRNYYFLGLHRQAVKSFDRSLKFAYKIKDRQESERRKQNVYDWKRSSFSYLGMMDSVYSNERKCMLSPRPMLYIVIAERHLSAENIDSAEYYINKANDLVLARKAPLEGKANVLRAYGELYIARKEYKKALEYLLESLTITQKMGNRRRDLEAYKLIAEVYRYLNDVQNENKYLIKYSTLNDSIVRIEKSILDMPIEKLLSEQAEDEKVNKKNLYNMVISIILACTAMIMILLNIYKGNQKKKNLLIDQKEKETDILRRKLNTTYEEVVQLAINGDPSLMTKFKETYSDFYNNLTLRYPGLTHNDLKFCAFIRLGFSNKEIAQYAGMSIRTVESKKYRLRKKMDLPPDTDFNSWVLSL
ncbi:tetratricopeptide (TPR) repeat protein [Chryseobacterium defluvii]|uniref:Tetratricopeptide (TPR) repeat protein n=1 Tax=Chryseobacterium defluvii TaxID=160396 RepID=A0A840KFA7_9FLAO|nr:sigma factor-like helix-turn-helix DNA-binding protein [Chryseobacterium defluvii]MBB4807876.1 tetratricopeptide (TPR) repeat protein [Chryseobacterium defluvii]